MRGLGLMNHNKGVVFADTKNMHCTSSQIIKEWHINNGFCKHCVESLMDHSLEFTARMHGVEEKQNIKDVEDMKKQIEDLLKTRRMYIPIGPCYLNLV